MEIETDRYLITTDRYNFILQMKEEVQDSHLLEDKSRIGAVRLGEKMFFSNLGHLIKRIISLSLLNDDEVQSMLDVANRIDSIAEEFAQVTRTDSV